MSLRTIVTFESDRPLDPSEVEAIKCRLLAMGIPVVEISTKTVASACPDCTPNGCKPCGAVGAEDCLCLCALCGRHEPSCRCGHVCLNCGQPRGRDVDRCVDCGGDSFAPGRTKPEPRMNLVNHIRDQIEAGTYDTEGRLRGAVDRMIERGDLS